MGIFGYFSFNVFIPLFVILHDYYTNQQDGALVAIWATSGDIGVSMGYIVPSVLIVMLGVPWEVSELIISALFAICIILIYLLVIDKHQPAIVQERTESQPDEGETNSVTMSEFGNYICSQLANPRFMIFTLVTCTINPIFNCFL